MAMSMSLRCLSQYSRMRTPTSGFLIPKRIRPFSSNGQIHLRSVKTYGNRWILSAILGTAVGGTLMFNQLQNKRGEETVWPKVLAAEQSSEEDKKDPPKVGKTCP